MADPVQIKKHPNKYTMPKPDGAREFTKGAKFTAEECRLIQIMMEDAKKVIPWKTDTDFIRWAVLSAVKTVNDDIASKRVSDQYAQILSTVEMLRSVDDARRHMDILERLRKTVDENERLGGHANVPRMLREVEKEIKAMQPGFWADKVKKQFYRDYGERLKADRISARPRDAEKDEE